MTKILTIDDLSDAMDEDPDSHQIKDLAELLCAAMTDWPTQNQTSISEFIGELYHFYGSPLTMEKIAKKELDFPYNSWKHEAGASIAQMIDLSTRFDGISDFEMILNRVLSFYGQNRSI